MTESKKESDQQYIFSCIEQIEKKLQWGPSIDWSNYDFEKLTGEIQEKTGVYLSITTLKRVFGRIKYPHEPSSTTLNTLAAFLGFPDWRAYKSQIEAQGQAPVGISISSWTRNFRISWIWLLILPLAFLFVFLLTLSFRKSTVYDSADFQFSADKVYSEGVPNSVIFTYDASSANTDSIFIVQTWDIRRKTRVSREGKKHSAIYYYPGFFRTKLIIEDQIVRSHDLQITSDGWLGLLELEDKPVYFKPEEIKSGEGVSIHGDLLREYQIPLNPVPPKIRIFNQGDLGDLMNDNFVFETELKNDFQSGNNSCQYVEVLIQCKDDIIIIPLCAKACIGDAYLYAAGASRTSKESDLSGFGADLMEWTHLKVEAVEKQMIFYVNHKLAESVIFPNSPTGIVGVQYRFNGTGAVKFARFGHEGQWLTMN